MPPSYNHPARVAERIATLDLIRDEFLRPGSAWVKWCWTALGLVFMSLLAFWI